MTGQVRDKADRFELEGEGIAALITYREAGGVVTLVDTKVCGSLAARDTGSTLVKGTLELLRRSGKRVIAQSGYVADYIRKHPEYQGLLADEAANKLDQRLDEALAETFPASDPTAVSTRD